MRRLLIHTENRFALSRTAYADSVDIALHEIPDGVYCTSPPEIVEQYYIEGSKEAKKYEIDHSQRSETGIKSVNDTECGGIYSNCKGGIPAAEGRHKIAPEYEFFTHALDKESEQIQCNNFKMDISAQTYAVCSGYYGK